MKEHEEDCPMSIQNKLEDMNIYKNALDLKEPLNIVGSALDKVSQNKKQIIFLIFLIFLFLFSCRVIRFL